MQITTFGKSVIFSFIDDSTSNRFINSTSSGILLTTQDNNQAQIPRWGKVTHVGESVTEVKVDDFILIDAGMWTPGFYVDKVRYWKTDEDKIVGVADEAGTTY